jgi:TonB family protein
MWTGATHRQTLAVTLGLLAVLSGAITPIDAQVRTVKMAESSIRRVARHKTMPTYPPPSLSQKHSGVAVAAIATDENGRVSTVSLLQAPDDAIGEAVRTALLQWEIDPVTVSGRTERFGVQGKVTFYFRLDGPRGRVFNPDEIPGGPKPEPASGPPSSGPGARPPAAGTPAVSRSAPETTTHDDSDMEIDEEEFARLAASTTVVVLDVRERDEFARRHSPGAINSPRNELAIRAYIELDRNQPVVVDCSFTETVLCHSAAGVLRRGPKIAKVFVLIP